MAPTRRLRRHAGLVGRSLQPQGQHPLTRVGPDLDALGTTVQPDATLALDCIEARFARRFRRLMEEANEQRAQPDASAAS